MSIRLATIKPALKPPMWGKSIGKKPLPLSNNTQNAKRVNLNNNSSQSPFVVLDEVIQTPEEKVSSWVIKSLFKKASSAIEEKPEPPDEPPPNPTGPGNPGPSPVQPERRDEPAPQPIPIQRPNPAEKEAA